MQDADKVRTSLLNFMCYADIEAALEISEQAISENKNNHHNNLFYLLIYYLHKNITIEENEWITQNKTFSYMKKFIDLKFLPQC